MTFDEAEIAWRNAATTPPLSFARVVLPARDAYVASFDAIVSALPPVELGPWLREEPGEVYARARARLTLAWVVANA